MKESALTTDFKKDLISQSTVPIYWHKIDDIPINSIVQSLYNMTCPRCTGKIRQSGIGRYQGRKKPFDVMALVDGIPIVIEFKMHNGRGSIQIDKVKDHQLKALSDFTIAGGLGFLAIGNQFEPKEKDEYNPAHCRAGVVDRMFLLCPGYWQALTHAAVNRGSKSIRLSDIVNDCEVIGKRMHGRGRKWETKEFMAWVKSKHETAGRQLAAEAF